MKRCFEAGHFHFSPLDARQHQKSHHPPLPLKKSTEEMEADEISNEDGGFVKMRFLMCNQQCWEE